MAIDIDIDVELLKSEIRKTYACVSDEPEREFIFPTGRAWAEDLGYPPELAKVPEDAVESFAGVANPWSLGWLQPGERVLDLGAGAGTDSLIAAQMVGEDGRVTGIDMTPEMLTKRRLRPRRWAPRTSSSSRPRQNGCRSRTGATTSSSRTASST
jgi:arsenite methyltransferase